MREVILGINDYLNDCWHDWLLRRIQRYYFVIKTKDYAGDDWMPLYEWKEGSILHYIRQRRITKKVKVLKEDKK